MTDSKEEEQTEKKEDQKDEATTSSEPPAKKKRGAERQITKDDGGGGEGEGEDDDGEEPKGPFQKASEEVLAKRKFLKAKRPFGSSSGSGGGTTGSSNPFASTSLSTNNGSSTKVFGASFGGFKTTTSTSTSSGFGAFGSSSTTTTGFGTAATSTGFGTSATTKDEQKPAETSLFGSSNTGFSFGFAKSASSPSKNGSSPSATSSSVKLPEHVELTTGEEDEINLHEIRCKSFKWVVQEAPKEDTTQQLDKDNPSVAPSSNFEKAVTSSTNNNDEESKEDKEKDEEKEKSSGHRWQELGVGPIRILKSRGDAPHKIRLVQRREASPNGPAHKVILNVPIWKESTCNTTSEKHLSLTTVGSTGESETYTLKFKEVEHAFGCSEHLKDAISQARSGFAK